METTLIQVEAEVVEVAAKTLTHGDVIVDDGMIRVVDWVESHTSTRGVRGVIVWCGRGGMHAHPDAPIQKVVSR